MALALARGLVKIGGLARVPPTFVQITAKYARYRRPRQQVEQSLEHPTYKVGGIFEPDYLHLLLPPTEQYEILDIDIKGYDFPVLEKFHAYIYKQIRDMGLEYLDSYGHPNQVVDIEVLKPNSEIVQEVYHLRSCKRTIQLGDVPVYKVGLLIDVLHATAPPGVTFTVLPHDEQREEDRFVPDVYMTETKRELESITKPR